jgi:hypothetical protein
MLVYGSKECVLKVIEKVKDIQQTVEMPENLKSHPWEQRNRELRILVPSDWVPEKLREKLSKIKDIQSLNNIHLVKSFHNMLLPGLNEAIVVINGKNEDFLKAGEALLEMMLADDKYEIGKDLNHLKRHTKIPKETEHNTKIPNETEHNTKIPNETKHNTLTNQLTTAKILTPTYTTAKLLGKKGEHIKDLKAETKCKIIMSDFGELFPGTTERVLLIRGLKEDVTKAIKKVREIQKTVDIPDFKSGVNWSQNRSRELRIVVPIGFAEELLLNNGEMLRKIKEMQSLEFFHCNKRFNASNPDLKEATLIMRGEDENVLKAGTSILHMISAAKKKFHVDTNLKYQQFLNSADGKPLWHFTLPDSFFE